jgi:hypothetical protein
MGRVSARKMTDITFIQDGIFSSCNAELGIPGFHLLIISFRLKTPWSWRCGIEGCKWRRSIHQRGVRSEPMSIATWAASDVSGLASIRSIVSRTIKHHIVGTLMGVCLRHLSPLNLDPLTAKRKLQNRQNDLISTGKNIRQI